MLIYRYVLIVCLWLGASDSLCAQELIVINGVYCTADSVPYVGAVTTYYPHGQRAAVYNFKNGLLHNTVIVYKENGAIDFVGAYYEGKKDGLWSSHDNQGRVLSQIRYTRGQKIGEWVIGDLYTENAHLLYYANDKLLAARSVRKKDLPVLSSR